MVIFLLVPSTVLVALLDESNLPFKNVMVVGSLLMVKAEEFSWLMNSKISIVLSGRMMDRLLGWAMRASMLRRVASAFTPSGMDSDEKAALARIASRTRHMMISIRVNPALAACSGCPEAARLGEDACIIGVLLVMAGPLRRSDQLAGTEGSSS